MPLLNGKDWNPLNIKSAVEVSIKDAVYPAPFSHALEFNPPAHGTWNIVHIGMKIPECQQIYVCAVNCMRGVVLTAAEMNAADRFSFVILKEEDLLEGTVEDVTIAGVADVIRKLPKRPPAVCLFTVCVHHFLGCDLRRIYTELEQEFPDIDFIRAFMDPIMQKEGATPDQKLRISMYQPLEDHRENRPSKLMAAMLGVNVPIAESSDLCRLLAKEQVIFRQAASCTNYEEYKKLGEADLFLSVVPNGKLPIEKTAGRLGKRSLYLPMSFSFQEIETQERELIRALDSLCEKSGKESETMLDEWFQLEESLCMEELKKTLQLIGKAPVMIDYTVHPRPLGLAKMLLEQGFSVKKVYLNAVSSEEKETFEWLQEKYPELILASTIQPLNRVIPRKSPEKTLAVGQQAAWFNGTGFFVNLVEGGDLQGFDGIRRMAVLMREAWNAEKDTEDLIPRKGLGCESCV